jgi:hypothetical protein
MALCLVAMLMLSLVAHADVNNPAPGRLGIQVQPGDWGDARAKDIQTVLQSVAEVFTPYFPQHAADRIAVSRSHSGPQVLAARSKDGAYRMMLDVGDTRWDQFTYQFAHELCHVFTNFEHRDFDAAAAPRDQHWFEEALCESMSLLALERVAVSWEQAPPYPEWRAYAGRFRHYAQRLRNQAHRHLPAQASLADWYDANRDALETNPYLREKNELVAGVLLQLLEQTPGGLEATGYLNLDQAGHSGSFTDYLARWHKCCPPRYEEIITRLIALFEGNAPLDAIAASAESA